MRGRAHKTPEGTFKKIYFINRYEDKDATMNTRRDLKWKLPKATGYCLKQTTATTYHGY